MGGGGSPTASPFCGDGDVNTPQEMCDGNDLGGATCASLTGDPTSTGQVTCNANCTPNATGCSTPPTCGNGMIDLGEECDGSVPAGKTCETELGAGATGSLSCEGCKLATNACNLCSGKMCNGSCLDTASDANNCGDCGVQCPGGKCAGGHCVECSWSLAQSKSVGDSYLYNDLDFPNMPAGGKITFQCNGEASSPWSGWALVSDVTVPAQSSVLRMDNLPLGMSGAFQILLETSLPPTGTTPRGKVFAAEATTFSAGTTCKLTSP